ncbi:MAG: cytochrome c biogenesis protein ResB [Candidatus Nanopelagicales bacterium]
MSQRGFLRWLWRQLTSMKTALILLFLLAIASIPGSILPQRGTNPILVEQWLTDNPTLGPILDSIGAFDVFGSPWYSAVYILLFISLIGCVLPRLGVHWKAMRSQPPPAPKNLSRMGGTAFECAGDTQTTIENARKILGKDRWRTVVGQDPSGVHWVAAEKGYLRETGNLVFHFSLILILVGVAVGGLFGWRGNVIVREGEGFSNTLTQYDAWGGGRLSSADNLPEFSFTLESFDVEFERENSQEGAPRLFEANMVVDRPGVEGSTRHLVEVNEPLVIDSAKVFLVGHGYAPHLIVRDSQGTVVLDDAVVFLPQDGNFTSTGVVKIPDTDPQLGFRGLFLPTSAVDEIRGPHSVFPAPDDVSVFFGAWEGDLGLDNGIPQSIYTLNVDDMTQLGLESLRVGQTWQLPQGAGSIELAGYERWASFQMASDPGKELALVAAILAILGLTLSLFIQRRRVWVKVSQVLEQGSTGTVRVEVAGIAKASGHNATEQVDHLVESLKGKTN